jgi:hypothetical protein
VVAAAFGAEVCLTGRAGVGVRVVCNAVVDVAAVGGHPATGELTGLISGDHQAGQVVGDVVGAEQRGVGNGDSDIDSATAPASPAITSATRRSGGGRPLDVVAAPGAAAVPDGVARDAVGTEWLPGDAFAGGTGVLAAVSGGVPDNQLG